ncbi:hypothetical protein NU688_00930 [Variovorax sp. ZS18.2.2]|uniref:hypothetical protein n=1 Tax=Variovorax sp. ZS18.2.2 TaxID=2971255 RepID=UPI00215088A9|nr:hypothetical protein [Variovorax sp. ZS18.2.2]MCR6474702.1 hypothetical protein [Variovorax sp. ZS18.2.2]
MNALFARAALLALLTSLASCGGGGGGGSDASGLPVAQQQPSPPAAASSAPLAASEKPDDPGPVQGLVAAQADNAGGISPLRAQGGTGFALLSRRISELHGETPANDKPDPGSTTAIGSGTEGLWYPSAGMRPGIAFIDAAGKYLAYEQSSPVDPDTGRAARYSLYGGAWAVSGSTWTFAPGSNITFTGGSLPVPMNTVLFGSGTFTPARHFEGLTGASTAPNTPIAYNYASANARAVSQADIAGSWFHDSLFSATIAPNGDFSGRVSTRDVGTCLLQGTAVQTYAGTAKNLYTVKLTPSVEPGRGCGLQTDWVYEGFASITTTAVGAASTNSPPYWYVRSITLMVRKYGSWFAVEAIKR